MALWDIFHPERKIVRVLERISDALLTSLLGFICSLPVLTSGSVICALYTVNERRVRFGESTSIREFLSDIRANLKNGCLFTACWIAVLAISFSWGIFLHQNSLVQLQIPVFAVVFFVLGLLCFVLPVSAILQKRPMLALRISLFLMLKAPWYAILKVLCLIAVGYLAFVLPIGMRYWVIPLMLIGGAYWLNALFCLLFDRIVQKALPQAKTRLEIISDDKL